MLPPGTAWKRLPIVNTYNSPIAVAEGVVYGSSVYRRVYALDTETGQYLWGYQTEGLGMTSPTVADGVVYVSTDYGYVYALQAQPGIDGSLGDGETMPSRPSPMVEWVGRKNFAVQGRVSFYPIDNSATLCSLLVNLAAVLFGCAIRLP